MQPGTQTESERHEREPVAGGSAARSPDRPAPSAPPEAPGDARIGEDDHLLGSPRAGMVVTTLLVVGVAGAVGVVMLSVIAMVVTAVVGALTAYVVAHDDDWARRARRRRARHRQIAVEPGWAGRSWGTHGWSEHGVGRHAA
ncbi:hypothetical protein [Rhodococcus sp. SGAir0479]|uniref:hypothetical protein n=1 Tax=Rhodococcus sp. SGAir0479 TaxID=2567884 RepID=UPI0020C7F6CC|nr:hypothetical protein [Rhodococcus sp. SGAir0479]